MKLINKIGQLFSATIILSAISLGVSASGDHNDGHKHSQATSHTEHKMDHANSGMFLKKKEIDGYTVSFHIMEAKDGMRHGGSHNFMIKVEKEGKALQNVVINSKVIHPDNKAESKMLMKMGDWFMNGYDLSHMGKHQMMILFKTADGVKHQGGVYYSK